MRKWELLFAFRGRWWFRVSHRLLAGGTQHCHPQAFGGNDLPTCSGSHHLQPCDFRRSRAGLGDCCVVHPPPPAAGSCRSQGQMPSVNKVLGRWGECCPQNRLGSLTSQTSPREMGKGPGERPVLISS